MGRAAHLRFRPDPSLDSLPRCFENLMMRRTGTLFAVFALLVPVGGAAAAHRADSTLQDRLAKALRVPHISNASSGAIAVDLDSGEQLFALNDTLPLAPASNEKLALTYALLSSFGPRMRIATTVKALGTQTATTLRGDLFLVGGGDPMLSSSDLTRLARRVRAAGISRVTGRVIGDESFFDAKRTCPGWKPSYYILESPPLSALVVDRAWFKTYTARRPARAAALLFRDALRRAGVSVGGGVTVLPTPLAAYPVTKTLSPPLRDIVRFMDLHSDNFTAEELLKLLGAWAEGRGTTAAGARAVVATLKRAGISTAGVRIVDGSGLSQKDRLTVGVLVSILQAAASDSAIQAELVHALPVAGVSGTLRDRMRTPNLLGHVVAKTGTTDIASSLSGYVNSHIAFAIIQNGHPLSYWYAREAQDRFAKVLASQ
jgi:serine-type D-Ala-D-Ala carboxypeptidase/endopeptidase (penicillin-binding protein 4)